MATVKQYVDLDGLSKFKELLVGKYTDGTYKVMTATNATNAEIATNYKTADGSASIAEALKSKVDSSTLTTEVNKLVPKTTTIAGVDLQNNITAEELIEALDASRKIVNVIETVKVKNNGDADFSALTVTNKAVEIDLSGYAKTSDITSVLKFKGTVNYEKDLPETEVKEGDVYHVRYSGSEGTNGLNAEYVRIGSRWEELGPVVDFSNYYTIDETNSAITKAVGDAKTEITTAYEKADTDLQNTLQGNIDALYKVDGENVTGVIATRVSDVESTADANEEAINTLNGDENTTGSVAKAIKDKIDALDSSSSMASDTDVKGGYVYSVSQTDGKVTVKTASFSGAVDSEDTNAVTGGAVATYVTGEIAKLDVEDVGSAGSFISLVGETDGKVHATATDFVATVKGETTDTDNIASNEHAVRQAIDSAYEMITSIPLEGKYGSIASLFTLISKTRDFITGTTEVAESDSVTSIADYAFYKYSALTSVSFPVATSIGYQSFYGCSALTSVSFPVATSIGEYAFQSCSSLTEVSFPKATSIGQYAFKDCSSLTSVSFPLATSIGGNAFLSCEGLTSVSFPEVISIDTWAFQYCSSLTSVSFPKATSIGQRAFQNCSNLTEISFPEATSTGEQAFKSCEGLTSVSFPKATSIGDYAFQYCSGLTKVLDVFFPVATSIGQEAFYECSALTSVSFPLVTSIGRNAFYNCSGLTEVSFPEATSIDGYAFRGCSGLTKVLDVFFPVATSIGEYAFQSCSGLTSVSFPKAKSIGERVFASCSSLTEVSFPEATNIGIYTFENCKGLTSVSFPVATSIGNGAFYGCSGLTSISFPVATSIGSNVFNGCSGLTEVSFPEVTSMSKNAFYGCSGLTSVSFPKATSIGVSAFQNCSKLTSVSFPVATSIEYGAFSSCSSLTEVSFLKATSIGNYAFYGCTGLTEVSFPEATSIGDSTFSNCSNLTTIYVGTNTSTVCTLSYSNTFTNCTNLTNIYVPASLVSRYKSAVGWSRYADKIKATPRR